MEVEVGAEEEARRKAEQGQGKTRRGDAKGQARRGEAWLG